jgi:hypothetical protein
MELSKVQGKVVVFFTEDGELQSKTFKVLSAVLFILLIAQRSFSTVNKEPSCQHDVASSPSASDPFIVQLGLKAFIAIGFFFAIFRLCAFIRDEVKVAKETKDRTGNSFDSKEYFLYRLDYLFSSSPYFKVFSLIFVTTVIIIVGGICWCFATGNSLTESLWAAWTFVADPGTHADSPTGMTRLVSLALSLAGMVLFALVIGIVSEDVGTYVENLRKGTSRVIESGHTLIIGQGDKLIPTIHQICLANESEGGGLIVILTPLPKEELESYIWKSNMDMKGTNVIVRTGNPHLKNDLQTVSICIYTHIYT